FQDGDDLVLSESDLTHSDLLRGHNQYVGRSLKMNGPFWWDTYSFIENLSLIKRKRRQMASF
ncbi:hypothetical protein J1781_00770, partial [Rahnella sp. C60]|uniref:hypothetical protein n=1 Tax=Rahnella perminowiae TaxID=2816244 RepID=UPI001C281315